jgi:hypothetical protein
MVDWVTLYQDKPATEWKGVAKGLMKEHSHRIAGIRG